MPFYSNLWRFVHRSVYVIPSCSFKEEEEPDGQIIPQMRG